MKFEVSLTTVLAFILPGAIVVVGTVLLAPGIVAPVMPIVQHLGGLSLVLFVSLCLGAGAIVDAIRLISTDPLTRYIDKKSRLIVKKWSERKKSSEAVRQIQKVINSPAPVDYLSRITDKNLPVFTMLIERTYEYYRLNANSSLAFLMLALLRGFYRTVSDPWLWVLMLGFGVWMCISVRSSRYTRQGIESFVKSTYAHIP